MFTVPTLYYFFFSSRRRHTRYIGDWSSDVCSSDLVCQRLSNILYSWLAPGGLLLATNVAPHNPLRNGMEHLLDWNLVYRNALQVQSLTSREARPDHVVVRSESTWLYFFLEVRKSNDV